MKIYTYSIFLLFLLISNLFLSCKKDQINTSTDIKLDFSTNNVQFDTVFTTIGSTTKRLLVYNNSSSKINISNISLVGGKNSNFRININGAPSNTATNIEVNPKDSLYIFVKVTVNPNNQNSPFVIRDSIMFNTNGNTQYVNLTAWGQNAYYHTPDHFSQDLPAYSIIKCNDIWKNDKPHVIYGWAVVDQGCKLSIQAGTKVHLFNNAVLWVYNGGSINVQGTANDPVIFQGTRLEQDYQDVPGQWGKIWLSKGSYNNVFNYAVIKNGIIGIQVDTSGNSSPTLIIKNTIIRNMSVTGLLAQGSYVKGWNNVFSNCGQYVMVLNMGGTYDFRQCTFANYWQNSIRQTPLLKINNYYVDLNGKIQFRAINKAYFGNCIIYGNIDSDNEIGFDNATNDTIGFNFNFTNCLLKLKDYNSIYKNKFTNCIFNQEPYFINPNNYNFELQNNSPAINNGDPQIILPYAWLHADIKGKSRVSDAAPDIGAYEK